MTRRTLLRAKDEARALGSHERVVHVAHRVEACPGNKRAQPGGVDARDAPDTIPVTNGYSRRFTVTANTMRNRCAAAEIAS